MIIEFNEGLLELRDVFSKTYGVLPEKFDTPEGQKLLMEIIMAYVKRMFYYHITNEVLSEAALMAEIASLLFKADMHETYTVVKGQSDMLVRYESASDTDYYDSKPEGKAYYDVCEFIEEAFRCVDETLMQVINQESPTSKEVVYMFRLPSGKAALTTIVGEAVINKSSVVRVACGSRKQYTDIIRSIVLD